MRVGWGERSFNLRFGSALFLLDFYLPHSLATWLLFYFLSSRALCEHRFFCCQAQAW